MQKYLFPVTNSISLDTTLDSASINVNTVSIWLGDIQAYDDFQKFCQQITIKASTDGTKFQKFGYIVDNEIFLEYDKEEICGVVAKELASEILGQSTLSQDIKKQVYHSLAKQIYYRLLSAFGGSISYNFYSSEVDDIGYVTGGKPLWTSGEVSGASDWDFPGAKRFVACPACFVKNRQTLKQTIVELNDRHRWTREQIADWLDELHDAGKINIEFDPWVEDKELTNEQG